MSVQTQHRKAQNVAAYLPGPDVFPQEKSGWNYLKSKYHWINLKITNN